MRLLKLMGVMLGVCAAAFGSTTIAVNDPAITSSLSPGNWKTNGSTSIIAINEGASIGPFNFTGTSCALQTPTGIQYIYVAYSVDGGAYSQALITPATTSTVLATGLSDTTHSVMVIMTIHDFDSSGNQWAGTDALAITGIVVDTGKVLTSATQPANGAMLFLGDSLTAGAGLQSTLNVQNWPRLVANNYNAPVGIIGFSGQGYEVGPPVEPVAIDTMPYIYNGVSRNFSAPVPRCVTVLYGYNGTTTAADVTAYLTALRAAIGSAPYIKQIVPFSQANVSAITTGVADYISANPSDTRVALIDLGAPGKAIVDNPTYAPDGTHLNIPGCAAMAPLLIPYYADAMGAISAATANITTLHVGP